MIGRATISRRTLSTHHHINIDHKTSIDTAHRNAIITNTEVSDSCHTIVDSTNLNPIFFPCKCSLSFERMYEFVNSQHRYATIDATTILRVLPSVDTNHACHSRNHAGG